MTDIAAIASTIEIAKPIAAGLAAAMSSFVVWVSVKFRKVNHKFAECEADRQEDRTTIVRMAAQLELLTTLLTGKVGP